MLYEAFLDEEMKTAQDFKDKKNKTRDDSYDKDFDINHRNEINKYNAGNKYSINAKYEDLPKHDIKSYEKARNYVAKSRDDLNSDTSHRGNANFNAASDAVERHDRRHPDRKIVESFDVSVFE